jgi:hypothetical protein
MKISKERIEEFKQIYQRNLGTEISDEEAYELALPLLQLFRVVCRPLPKGHRCRACQPPEPGGDFDKTSASS